MTTWWRRNRLWVALLIPALLLAIALSAFRWMTLYQPWEWSAGTSSNGPSGTFTQTFLGFDDKHHERTVHVTVNAVEPVESLGDEAAVDGATMWRIDLRFEADPNQLLAGACRVTLLDAAGTEYGYQPGRRQADPNGPPLMTKVMDPQCVPEETPGPDLEPFTGELIEPSIPRPRTWDYSTSVVLPDGVTPERVRIGWNPPEYLELRTPR